MARVSWGVLREALVWEALINLKEPTMMTMVQGVTFPLLASDWRAQLQDTFEFTTRKILATICLEMTNFFPSLKNAAE